MVKSRGKAYFFGLADRAGHRTARDKQRPAVGQLAAEIKLFSRGRDPGVKLVFLFANAGQGEGRPGRRHLDEVKIFEVALSFSSGTLLCAKYMAL